MKNNFKQLEAALTAFKKEPSPQQTLKIAFCYHNIADLLSSIECNTIAVDYYKLERDTRIKAYQESPTDELLMSIANSNQDIGRAYCKLKEYDKAIWYNQKALIIMDKVSEITDTNTTATNIATIHYDIGKLYNLTEDFDKAIASFTEALLHKQFVLKDNPQHTISLDISRICNALCHSYHNKKNYGMAAEYNKASKFYKLPIADQQEIKNQDQEPETESVIWERIIAELEEVDLSGDGLEYAA